MKTNRKRLDWGIAIVYTLFLYATLPFAPWVYYRIESLSGRSFGLYLNILLLCISIGLLGFLVLIRMEKSGWPYLWLGFVGLGYGLFLSTIELSSERIHFLEYGLLSCLLMTALSHDLKGPRLLLIGTFTIAMLGFVDEGIQGILPNRFFELKDVGMNTAGGLLGVLLSRFVISPDLHGASEQGSLLVKVRIEGLRD